MVRLTVHIVFCLCLLIGFGSVAMAAVSGRCDNCHTMHNSQDGAIVAKDKDNNPLAAADQQNLLNTDCVGCHTSTTGNTIVGSTPIVYNTIAPTQQELAGGNFFWVVNSGDEYGHNVYGISAADGTLSTGPGGPSGCDATDCHSTLANASWGVQKIPNGCQGCHVPRHHADAGDTIVDRDDGWYRFLGAVMPLTFGAPGAEDPATGVKGIEDADWEQTLAAGDHNVYQGYDSFATPYGSAGLGPYISRSSIAEKCSGCHGNFHHDMQSGAEGGAGAWIRHPSDIPVPSTGEYASFNGDGSTYSTLAPVAQSVAGLTLGSTVTLDSDVVTCISCHRAHGSQYPDMLRWNYAGECLTGVADPDCGCFVCHTGKD